MKEKIIIVNKYCEINQENVALSVKNRRIAINVVQKVKDEKGFINYCLAVDDEQFCCEKISFGYREKADFDKNNVYISKIVSNIFERDFYSPNYSSTYICEIYGKEKESDLDDKVIAIGYVKNKANAGYYYHTIYEYENGKIVYESEL